MTTPETPEGLSFPGMGPDDPLVPQADKAEDESSARARAAAYDDACTALRFGRVAVVPTATLIALALTSALEWWPLPGDGYAAELVASGPWPRSLLAIVLLMVALQLVSALLALEHLMHGAEGPRRRRAMTGIIAMRFLVLAAVVGAVVVAFLGPWDTWLRVALAGTLVEAVTLTLLALSGVWVRRWVHEPSTYAGPFHAVKQRQSEQTSEKAVEQDSDRLVAIGASGGGIRAAAFVLGGHQVLQDQAAALGVDDEEKEPAVFAVSGGSYVAAALALRRSFTPAGKPRQKRTPWATAYDMDSPELERLRRHTRYLFEPSWAMRDGAVSLLMGAAVNLLLVAVALRFLTWVSAQISMTVGLVVVNRDLDGRLVGMDLAPGWGFWWEWLLFLAIPLVCLAVMIGSTIVSWLFTSSLDNPQLGTEWRRRTQRVRAASARLRPALVGIGAGWLLIVLVIPAGVFGVVSLMATNQPTAGTATWLDKAGFGGSALCQEAMVAQVRAAVTEATAEARISPGETREITTGACGFETTVSRTYDPANADGAASGEVSADEEQAARALVSDKRFPGRVAGIGALLLAVIALLRRGPAPQSNATSRIRTRLRRAVMTWLPLTIVGGIAVYLMLRWTLGFLIGLDQHMIFMAALGTSLTCLVAYLIDANATSMHGFYRSRLSDAFAVGVDDETRVAGELPAPIVYRFSQLGQGVVPGQEAGGGAASARPHERALPLHIVTTLNSQAANEAPTMRGGFPMVFGAEKVSIYREARQRVCVTTKDFEEFAGLGRVSIMATVATSGAAISPLMGRYGEQIAPYRLLLTLFNLRVGTWVRNPMHVQEAVSRRQRSAAGADESRRERSWRVTKQSVCFLGGLLWLTSRPGLAQVALEAFGNSSANRRWIYLSDGGHLDNTGLVECVRHCVNERTTGRIVVLDASNDPVGSWSAVGDAISVIRADLGVDLRRVWLAVEPPWMRRYVGSDLDIVVVKAVRTTPPDPDWNDRDWTLELPPNVRSFQLVDKEFPRSATLRQKFGDLEFEAYRSLGYAATHSSLRAAEWI